jgi:hypothetical protein
MIYKSTSKMYGTTVLIFVLALISRLVWAGPGAHGPSGEHLDTPRNLATGDSLIKRQIEAKSDLFELVGTLEDGEFSILIDRFPTNEPVLNARVEIESGNMKAQATFHDDLGDYSVDNPALLRKLHEPGEHPLVITIIAGSDSDLLDAVLQTEVAPIDQYHHTRWPWWSLMALTILVLLAIAVMRLRKPRQRTSAQEGLS